MQIKNQLESIRIVGVSPEGPGFGFIEQKISEEIPVILEKSRSSNQSVESTAHFKTIRKKVFVDLTITGDLVQIDLNEFKDKKSKNFVFMPIRFLEKSSERVEPKCKHFGVCGGCSWQHIPYQKQLEIKTNGFKKGLRDIGLNFELEIFPSEKSYAYRRRVHFQEKMQFYSRFESKEKRLFSVEECPILVPELQSVLKYESYRKLNQRVDLKFKGKIFESEVFLQANENGEKNLHEFLKKLKISIYGLNDSPKIYDFYGGSGVLGKIFSDNPIVVDLFTKQGINMSVGNYLKKNRFLNEDYDLILNPPRKGLHSDLPLLISSMKFPPKNIFWISCSPRVWLKEVRHFLDRFQIVKGALFDFYPQTPHLEFAAHLKLKC